MHFLLFRSLNCRKTQIKITKLCNSACQVVQVLRIGVESDEIVKHQTKQILQLVKVPRQVVKVVFFADEVVQLLILT